MKLTDTEKREILKLPDDTMKIVDTVLRFYPDVQAIYLFGSYGTEYERPDSDVDLALLLPPSQAKAVGTIAMTDCWSALLDLTGRPVDLINLRQVNTVFQFRVVQTGQLIDAADRKALAEFEMMTMTFYQKLQEERAAIVADIVSTKRILQV